MMRPELIELLIVGDVPKTTAVMSLLKESLGTLKRKVFHGAPGSISEARQERDLIATKESNSQSVQDPSSQVCADHLPDFNTEGQTGGESLEWWKDESVFGVYCTRQVAATTVIVPGGATGASVCLCTGTINRWGEEEWPGRGMQCLPGDVTRNSSDDVLSLNCNETRRHAEAWEGMPS